VSSGLFFEKYRLLYTVRKLRHSLVSCKKPFGKILLRSKVIAKIVENFSIFLFRGKLHFFGFLLIISDRNEIET